MLNAQEKHAEVRQSTRAKTTRRTLKNVRFFLFCGHD